MQESSFEIYLSNDPSISSAKAVQSRIGKARLAETILGMGLDDVVSDDDTMFEALRKIQSCEDPKHNPIQNAVRKYYKFVNGKEFPRMRNYHSAKHP